MKNLVIIIIALFAFTSSANAQLISSLTTKTEGGIIGNINSITPQVAFYEANTDLMNETMLFADAKITSNDEQTVLTINAKNGGKHFENFCNSLTSKENTTLKVGHKINKVKSHVGRSIGDWFTNTDFTKEDISTIELVITKVNFDNSTDNWTNFSYEVTLNIYGAENITTEKLVTSTK